jgi:hypothetical protein
MKKSVTNEITVLFAKKWSKIICKSDHNIVQKKILKNYENFVPDYPDLCVGSLRVLL